MSASRGIAWWRDAVVYQVYPRSFADSDGDGIGDLLGITGRLDHLVELGVDAVWLSPFYRSPQHDAGYDVADHRDVDPLFGKLADFDALLAAAHVRKLRVIIDLVPNHSSDLHTWFRAALAAGPGSPERDRYVFRDGNGPQGAQPPNNWASQFGGAAWTRVPDGQWYLHLFDVHQPDFNWGNLEVRLEFESILRFWLDRGVNGFRVDVAHGLIKANGLPDWPPPMPDPATVDSTDHEEMQAAAEVAAPYWDQDGVHEIYRRWRSILDSYPGDRIMVAEAWVSPTDRLARYVRPDEMNQAFNFDYLTSPWHAAGQKSVITATLEAASTVGAPSTWVLSNHDVIRHATRLAYPTQPGYHQGIGAGDPEPDIAIGLQRGRAATLLMLALPGAAYLYQGEEMGLPEDVWLPDEARQDPTWTRSGHTIRGRDGCRVPLPWHADSPSYGFGPGPASWLPQPEIWARYALSTQRGVAASTYEMYRRALALRREYRLGAGSVAFVDTGSPDVVAFRNGQITVMTNYGSTSIDLPALAPVHVSMALGPLAHGGRGQPARPRRLPPDTTVWLRDETA
jgi:alpha-glucosidase